MIPLVLASLGLMRMAAAQGVTGLPAPTVPDGFGVNIHFTDPQPGEMARFHEGGFGFARMDFVWSRIEQKPGVYDFSPYDRLYKTLAEAGTRPLFILDYGNDVYEKGPPRSPAAIAAFARFAAAAVRHFAGKGVVWEIWNEPNGDGFWPPHDNPTEYANMALAAAKAIRVADPHATLIAPGSSGFPWEYLETVFKSGLLQYLDGVSVHPYRGSDPESAAADFARLRGLIGRYAPPDKRQMPMISSEWGYPTQKGGISEERQGQYIVREWLANLASGVDLSIYYDWKEDGTNPTDAEHHFGTVRPDYTPKPAFTAAHDLIAGLRGYTFRHRLRGKTDDDWQLLFQRGDSGDLALVTWNASATAAASEQSPSIRKLAATDADYRPMLRLASIRFPYGPVTDASDRAAHIDISYRNPEKLPAKVRVGIWDDAPTDVGDFGQDFTIPPGGHGTIHANGFPEFASLDPAKVAIQLTWNNEYLPSLADLVIRRTDPFVLTVVPFRDKLRVRVENPAEVTFKGSLLKTAYNAQNPVLFVPVRFSKRKSVATVDLSLPDSNTPFDVQLWGDANIGNGVVAMTRAMYLKPMADFPVTVTNATSLQFHRTDFVENAAVPGKTDLTFKAIGKDDPADIALDFDYHFTPGWQYTEAIPSDAMKDIPADALSLVFWVREDGSGNALRARFVDATGQCFQPGMGQLSGDGWRAVTIPLDGKTDTAHWGGANDGVPHLPLRWDSLLLIDSASKTAPKSGHVLVAAPYYVFAGNPKTPAGH